MKSSGTKASSVSTESVIRTLIEIDDLNVLLVGNLCCGKTILLNIIIREYYELKENEPIPENNILYINNLKEQGISFFRTEMKTHSQSTLVSPYPQHNYSQLEMRRKIEVLKYSNNSHNSKNKTWSDLVKGNNRNSSQEFVRLTSIMDCPADDLLPTLSSSCDIPGKVFTLQLDPNVPLYNYVTNSNRTYN